MPVPSGHETCRAGSQRARLLLSLSHYKTTPREGKGRREAGWRKLGTRATTFIPTLTKFLLTYPVPSYLISSLLSFFPFPFPFLPRPSSELFLIDGEERKNKLTRRDAVKNVRSQMKLGARETWRI